MPKRRHRGQRIRRRTASAVPTTPPSRPADPTTTPRPARSVSTHPSTAGTAAHQINGTRSNTARVHQTAQIHSGQPGSGIHRHQGVQAHGGIDTRQRIAHSGQGVLQRLDDRINDHIENVGMSRRRVAQRAHPERQHRPSATTQADNRDDGVPWRPVTHDCPCRDADQPSPRLPGTRHINSQVASR